MAILSSIKNSIRIAERDINSALNTSGQTAHDHLINAHHQIGLYVAARLQKIRFKHDKFEEAYREAVAAQHKCMSAYSHFPNYKEYARAALVFLRNARNRMNFWGAGRYAESA